MGGTGESPQEWASVSAAGSAHCGVLLLIAQHLPHIPADPWGTNPVLGTTHTTGVPKAQQDPQPPSKAGRHSRNLVLFL